MDTFGSARGANSGVGGAASSAATRGHVADLEAQLSQVSSICSINYVIILLSLIK